jgi:hypothetical protein
MPFGIRIFVFLFFGHALRVVRGVWRYSGTSAKREIGALRTLITFQAPDPFPALRLGDRAPAERLRVIRELIQCAQMANSNFGNDFHIHK